MVLVLTIISTLVLAKPSDVDRVIDVKNVKEGTREIITFTDKEVQIRTSNNLQDTITKIKAEQTAPKETFPLEALKLEMQNKLFSEGGVFGPSKDSYLIQRAAKGKEEHLKALKEKLDLALKEISKLEKRFPVKGATDLKKALEEMKDKIAKEQKIESRDFEAVENKVNVLVDGLVGGTDEIVVDGRKYDTALAFKKGDRDAIDPSPTPTNISLVMEALEELRKTPTGPCGLPENEKKDCADCAKAKQIVDGMDDLKKQLEELHAGEPLSVVERIARCKTSVGEHLLVTRWEDGNTLWKSGNSFFLHVQEAKKYSEVPDACKERLKAMDLGGGITVVSYPSAADVRTLPAPSKKEFWIDGKKTVKNGVESTQVMADESKGYYICKYDAK